MVSHQSDATIGAGNSSYLVSFPAKFMKGLPQCAVFQTGRGSAEDPAAARQSPNVRPFGLMGKSGQ